MEKRQDISMLKNVIIRKDSFKNSVLTWNPVLYAAGFLT
jgi:hypothetical protein